MNELAEAEAWEAQMWAEYYADPSVTQTCANDSANCQAHDDPRIREAYAGGCTVHPYDIEFNEWLMEREIAND